MCVYVLRVKQFRFLLIFIANGADLAFLQQYINKRFTVSTMHTRHRSRTFQCLGGARLAHTYGATQRHRHVFTQSSPFFFQLDKFSFMYRVRIVRAVSVF